MIECRCRHLLSNANSVDSNICSRVDVDDESRFEWKNYVIVAARDSLSVESARGISLASVIIVRFTPASDVIPRSRIGSVVKRI